LEIKDFLIEMSKVPHVPGYEGALYGLFEEAFSKYANVSADKFGNFIAHKPGCNKDNKNGPKLMVAAHMDEIGMMVTAVCDRGFVKFTRMGGIDQRNMLAQEVIIHGRERKVFGVIGIKPPHLTSPEERKKAVDMHDMSIDTGYSKEALENLVRPGDIITFKQDIVELQNGRLAGRALDDAAGVAAMLVALKNLEHFNHDADLYFVATAQEEVGLRGAETATYTIKPDIGLAVDVTFAKANGLGDHEAGELGKGPSLAVGVNINRKLFENLKKTATKNGTKYQVEVDPYPTGTDGNAMQIAEGGVITGLVSIPLKYMHSTVETVAISDIEGCGKLLADYVMSLQGWEGEECFY